MKENKLTLSELIRDNLRLKKILKKDHAAKKELHEARLEISRLNRIIEGDIKLIEQKSEIIENQKQRILDLTNRINYKHL